MAPGNRSSGRSTKRYARASQNGVQKSSTSKPSSRSRQRQAVEEQSRFTDSDSDSDKEDESLELNTERLKAPSQKSQSYASLLKSFHHPKDEEPRKKRRKLNGTLDVTATFADPSPANPDSNFADALVISEDESELESEPEDDADDNPLQEEDDSENDATATNRHIDDGVSEDEDGDDANDSFEVHLNPELEDLNQQINRHESQKWKTAQCQLGTFGKCSLSGPGAKVIRAYRFANLTSAAEIPHLKKRLQNPAGTTIPRLDHIQKALAAPVFDYFDVIYPSRDLNNANSLRSILSLHALNHVFKTRDRVLKDNERLIRNADDTELELRDQGFTRPKVLFLLPTRQACAHYVKTIIDLCEPEQQENRKRFEDSYFDADRHFGNDRPADFLELFEGNADDDFRIGVKFTRKNMKLFSQFYTSDIILASPLGLRLAILGKTAKSLDHDFLSSIELVVVDQADAMLMQTWEHVEFVFEHLNLHPKEAHGCDFSRVRHWYLDGHAKYLRQTILLSAFLTPDMNALSTKHMMNVEGKIKYQPCYKGAIENLGVPFRIKQTFSRFESHSPAGDPDARFEHFKATLVPLIQRLVKESDEDKAGILVFIPSTLDFARLRNYFENSNETRDISFETISENAPRAENQRVGDLFRTGRHSVLLYTGRAHHFYRYRLKGTKRIIMYGLPDNPTFYQELVGGFLSSSIKDGVIGEDEAAVQVMFSTWDVLKLERIVGTKRVKSMVKQNNMGDTFDFI